MIWQNWGRTVACSPIDVATPASTEEVQAVVRDAAHRGLVVKVIGAGHSFSPIAEAPGIQVSLDRCNGIVGVDRETKQVTVRAGTRLHALGPALRSVGLAMQNLGDIDRQSIAGALSTGTHGTGLGFGGLSTQVRGLVLVDGRGDVHRIEGDDVRSHVVGLGALGIVTEVTLQCVDAFVLDALEQPEPLTDVLSTWEQRIHDHDHFEFFWFPHTDTALTKAQRRLPGDAPRKPIGRLKRWIDDDLVANKVYGLTCAIGAAAPALVPTINRTAVKLTGDRHAVDFSTDVYTTHRDVRFREMEYGIPVAALPEAVARVRDLIKSRRWTVSFPVECRAAQADDRWLSTACERDTAYVAVHRYWREDHRPYFEAVEEIMADYEGRPHWGKMHSLDRSELSRRYPRFEEFAALRDQRDPDRIFVNPHLDRILGR